MERRLTAIMAADVVGYSRMMGADEAGTLALMRHHKAELIDPCIEGHQGRVVKETGDGILAEFRSVVNAVACAIEIQRGIAARNASVPREKQLLFRIGVNLGDIIVENDDIFGDGVNVAVRLEGIAEPGRIAVSASVRDQIGARLDISFDDRGEVALKNIEHNVRVYMIDPAANETREPNRTAEIRNRSIAVLPFTNMSGDAEQSYFSDGITEDIITDLSKISGLHVVARNTVFTYKGRAVRVEQAARELGVGFILEGSVRKAGQRVRVTGQLVDGRTGDHLWAERFDRDLTDIFAIQDEITHAIVDQLKIQLQPSEVKAISTTPTRSVQAYTYYLRGRQFAHEWTKSYLLLARRMFAKAAELDPSYARAYSGIADCDSAMRVWHAADASLDTIMEMAARALSLDPSLAEAHTSRAVALDHAGRDAEAIEEFERALSLDPGLFEANLHYGRFLFGRGDFNGAVPRFERAALLRTDDYLSPILLMSACRSLGHLADTRRWAETAIQRASRAIELHPENAGAAHRGALALAHLGQGDRARDWAELALVLDPDDSAGRYNVVCAYSVLGDVEEAIDLFETLLPFSSPFQLRWYRHDSDLDALRTHQRFVAIVESLEMQGEARRGE